MILQMPTGMFRDCSTGAKKADGSPQDQACFDQGLEADNLTPVDTAVYYHKWADKCPIQDDPLCPTGDSTCSPKIKEFYTGKPALTVESTYHPALTVESTTGCSSAADCDCPTEGGWVPGWCDQGNCWYVRPSSLKSFLALSLVRATSQAVSLV